MYSSHTQTPDTRPMSKGNTTYTYPLMDWKGLAEHSSFSLKTTGYMGNDFRQRIQRSLNKGSEGLSSGLRNQSAYLFRNIHEKNLVWGWRDDGSVSKVFTTEANTAQGSDSSVLKWSTIPALGGRDWWILWGSLSSHCTQVQWDTMPQNLQWRATEKDAGHKCTYALYALADTTRYIANISQVVTGTFRMGGGGKRWSLPPSFWKVARWPMLNPQIQLRSCQMLSTS